MGHDSSRTERSAFAESLSQGWRRLCEGFEQLLRRGRFEEPDSAAERLQGLEQLLHAQLVLEEEHMLPAFELEAHEQAELLRSEHRQLRRLLDQAAQELAQDNLSRSNADALLDALQGHARHTQQLLHGWADQCLPQRAKVRVLERLNALWLESELPPVLRSPLRSGMFASSADEAADKRSAK